MPRAIDKEMLGGGKSSGLLARLRMSTKKSAMVIKLEKVDKHILDMVNRKELPPNTLCISDAALPIAHFQHLSRQRRARSRSPDKTRSASTANESAGGVPSLEDLFTRGEVLSDPVLALFPRLRESPPMMAHFSAAWAYRYKNLSDKDKGKDEVLRKLVRECTLIVWPLMKMRALKDDSAKEAGAREAAVANYMKAANQAKSLGDMQSVIAAGGNSVLAHQPFRIEELLE